MTTFVALFYANNGILADWCLVRHQVAINTLVDLFGRVELRNNTLKTKCMMIVPGRIQTRLSDGISAAANWGQIGKGLGTVTGTMRHLPQGDEHCVPRSALGNSA